MIIIKTNELSIQFHFKEDLNTKKLLYIYINILEVMSKIYN